jgi:excinuclease UvrABC helicase subunit UvrB
MKSFDDLFNEFFNRKRLLNPMDEVKKLIESLTNNKMVDMDIEGALSQQLGLNPDEPSSKEEYIEDGIKYTKLVWDTPNGKFVKIFITDVVENLPSKMVTNKSLEEQLQEAVDNEDYELAIKLRDQIKKKRKKVE